MVCIFDGPSVGIRVVGLERSLTTLIFSSIVWGLRAIRNFGTSSGTLEPAVFTTASWRIRLAAYGARLERVLG